jgi:hypothetical protein
MQRHADLHEPEHHLALVERDSVGVVDERVQLTLVRVLHHDTQHVALQPSPLIISAPQHTRVLVLCCRVKLKGPEGCEPNTQLEQRRPPRVVDRAVRAVSLALGVGREPGPPRSLNT